MGGDIIGHCEEKVHMNICLTLNGYRDRAAGIYQYANTVNGNNKEKLITVNFNLMINPLALELEFKQ